MLGPQHQESCVCLGPGRSRGERVGPHGAGGPGYQVKCWIRSESCYLKIWLSPRRAWPARSSRGGEEGLAPSRAPPSPWSPLPAQLCRKLPLVPEASGIVLELAYEQMPAERRKTPRSVLTAHPPPPPLPLSHQHRNHQMHFTQKWAGGLFGEVLMASQGTPQRSGFYLDKLWGFREHLACVGL